MSHSVEDTRRGLILLVDYLKAVHGKQVVHEINSLLGTRYGLKLLYRNERTLRYEQVYPILSFAGIEPDDFESFVSRKSYGVLPLYLYEIECLSREQVRNVKRELQRKGRNKATAQLPHILELEKQRFHLPPQRVAQTCWATLRSSSKPAELYEAWGILSTHARGQGKYSRAAYCARQALLYSDGVPCRGQLLQRISYLALHLCDSLPAIEIIRDARREFEKVERVDDVAKTYVDEAQVHYFRCDFEQAVAIARFADRLLPQSETFYRASLQELYGVAHLNLGDIERAKEAQNRFAVLVESENVLDTHYWNAYVDYLKAQILVAEGRFYEALKNLQLLHSDPSDSMQLLDRTLIALSMMRCYLALGRPSEVRPLVRQTQAFLSKLRPQTPAIRMYQSTLRVLEVRAVTDELIQRLIRKIRNPPPTLRRQGKRLN